uniref:PX domain-containing protein n=1 Tax=Panagrellus redivivus TaxID=6233 RepID=A0A7E4VWR0_PANRE
MPMNTTLRSSLLSVTECENLHWRFEVQKTSNEFVTASLIVSGETHRVSVRGRVICGAHEGVYTFNTTLAAPGLPYFIAPAIASSRFGPAGYIRVELKFTNYTREYKLFDQYFRRLFDRFECQLARIEDAQHQGGLYNGYIKNVAFELSSTIKNYTSTFTRLLALCMGDEQRTIKNPMCLVFPGKFREVLGI